jgi:hypothetical protein
VNVSVTSSQLRIGSDNKEMAPPCAWPFNFILRPGLSSVAYHETKICQHWGYFLNIPVSQRAVLIYILNQTALEMKTNYQYCDLFFGLYPSSGWMIDEVQRIDRSNTTPSSKIFGDEQEVIRITTNVSHAVLCCFCFTDIEKQFSFKKWL